MQKRGCNSIMGALNSHQEKKKELGPRNRCWALMGLQRAGYRFGSSLGRVQKNRTGSREYIKGVRPSFSHFPLVFLSLPYFQKDKLSSLSSSSPMEKGGRRGFRRGGRRVIAAEPPRRSLKALFFFVFFCFSSSTPLPKAVSNPKIPKYKSYIPRSKKE